MKFHVSQYIESIALASGYCINTGKCGRKYWTGFVFTVRDDLDSYNSISEWRENLHSTTEYFYRDFHDDGYPDIVRGEFTCWYTDYAGSTFMDMMMQLENVIYIRGVQNKLYSGQILSNLEQISLYIDEYRYTL
jgi:hypothetical protein